MALKESMCSGKTLKLTFMQNIYLQVINQSASDEPILDGIEANFLKCLASSINFTYNLHETEAEKYGTRLKDNSWTGIVGRLYDKKADFGLTGLTVTNERRAVIDFSVIYRKETRNFFVGVQEATRSSILFLSPFKVDAWLAELACVIMVSLIMYYFSRLKLSSFTIIFAIAANQGVDTRNVKLPASLIIISWLMTCTIFNIHYGNELKASTSVSNENSMDTLDDVASVLRLGTKKFIIQQHSALVAAIENMPSSPYGHLFRRVGVVRERRPTDYTDIYNGRIITAYPRTRAELLLLKAGYPPSKVRAVNEPIMSLNTAIGFQKNFTCQASFNWVITALSESGCLQKWQDKLMLPVTLEKLHEKDTSNANYISLEDLVTTFGLLFTSYFGGLLMVFSERFKKRGQK